MSEPIRLPTETEHHDRLWQAVLTAEEWHIRSPNSWAAAAALSAAVADYARHLLACGRAAEQPQTDLFGETP